jgi:hypothetical protein
MLVPVSNLNIEFRDLSKEIFEKLESGSVSKNLLKDVVNQIG